MINKKEAFKEAIRILEEQIDYIFVGNKISNININIKIKPGEVPTVEIYKEIMSVK